MREQQKEWKLGYPNSFPNARPLGPEGNHGALSQPCPRLVGTRLLGLAIRPALAAAPSRRGGEPALTRSSSRNRSRSHTPLVPSQPHGDLKTSSANLRKQLFPGSQTAEGKGAGLRRVKVKETRTKSESTGGLDAWTRAARRRTHPAAKGKHKSRSESCGRKGESSERKGEKGWAGPPSPTRGRDPRSDPRGPRPRAGAASSRRARPRHRARVPGSGRVSRCRARLHVPAGPRAGETVRISSACGSVPAAVLASCRRAGVGKASRTHQVQSQGTHRVRPGAHSELPRHSQPLREPERAPSPGDPPRLRYGRPSP